MPPKKAPPPKAQAKVPAAKSGVAKNAPGKGAPVKKGPQQNTGAKKNVAPAKGKLVGKAVAKPKERVWTKDDDAARKIQTTYRMFRARKLLEQKKKDKKEYEELMDKLENEALVYIVKKQQAEAEKERKAEEEERRRKADQKKRIKRVLEAAFDGENDEINTVIQEITALDDKNGIPRDDIGNVIRNKHIMAIIECEDANENSAVSEAANGGCADTLRLLLEKGANPNKVGQFRRTPLYRAAFAGHLEACQCLCRVAEWFAMEHIVPFILRILTDVLLQYGADPRIYGGDGQTPEQVASVEAVREFLQQWDIEQTELLLQKLEADQDRRLEADKRRREAEQNKLEEQIVNAQKEYDIKKKQVDRAYCELEKRITEHDTAADSGFDRTDLTLQTIHDAETDLELMKIEYEKARDKLAEAKLKLREQQKGAEDDGTEMPGLKVLVRELDDVLLRDVGNKISDSGKWPLIIDTTGQAATFLRYRDTNYMNALRPADMEPEKFRIALLGAIRFGKPLVLDMMGVDMFDTVADRLDEIQKGLMSSIMDKSILKDQKYLTIAKAVDGEEYTKTRFNEMQMKNFRFFIITKNPYPPDTLVDQTYLIRIYIPT